MFKALIPLDGSEFSRSILASVTKLLDPVQYELTLLRVAAIPEGHVGAPARPLVADGWSRQMFMSERDVELSSHPVYSSQVMENVRAEHLHALSEDARTLEQAGFVVNKRVRFGEPAQEIADLVEEDEFDLVVMATHGRSGVTRLVMGSVAEKVMHSLRIPVMLLRPVARAKEAEPIARYESS